MSTSAPSGPVGQRADGGTRALHAYVCGTVAAGPGFPLCVLACAPQDKQAKELAACGAIRLGFFLMFILAKWQAQFYLSAFPLGNG